MEKAYHLLLTLLLLAGFATDGRAQYDIHAAMSLQMEEGETLAYRYESTSWHDNHPATPNVYPLLYQNMSYGFTLTVKSRTEEGDMIVTLRPDDCTWTGKEYKRYHWRKKLRNRVYALCREKGVDLIMSGYGNVKGVANFNELKEPIVSIYADYTDSLDRMSNPCDLGQLTKEYMLNRFDEIYMPYLFPGLELLAMDNRWNIDEEAEGFHRVAFERSFGSDGSRECRIVHENVVGCCADSGLDYAFWMYIYGMTASDDMAFIQTDEHVVADARGRVVTATSTELMYDCTQCASIDMMPEDVSPYNDKKKLTDKYEVRLYQVQSSE